MDKTELERRADAIDVVLAQHRIDARVNGGTVTPRNVIFQVSKSLPSGNGLADSLALALSVPAVVIEGNTITAKRTDVQPVNLLSLMGKLPKELPPYTATLGLCDDGAPLLARLPSKDVGHVLVMGPDGCGKSSLLRTMAVSLAVCNRPRDMRLVLVGHELGSLAGLPHVQYFTTDNGTATGAIADLARLLGRVEPAPRVVMLIDGLAAVNGNGNLARLLKDGHAAGVHIVASGNASKAGFGTLITGRGESGDFEVEAIRFQAAYVTPAEIRQVVIGAMPKREPTRLQHAAALLASVN